MNTLNQKTKSQHGFTLVEVMIVCGIIGLVAAIGIPNFVRYRENSRRSVCIANLKQMQNAKTQWAFEKAKPASAVPVESEIIGRDNYLKEKPACPGGGADYMTTIGSVDQRAACTLGVIEGHSL